jgi:hypothetical protein
MRLERLHRAVSAPRTKNAGKAALYIDDGILSRIEDALNLEIDLDLLEQVLVASKVDRSSWTGQIARFKYLIDDRDDHVRRLARLDMLIDVFREGEEFSIIFLVTDDIQLCTVITELRRRGVRVIILSTARADHFVLPNELPWVVDEFVELGNIAESSRQTAAAEGSGPPRPLAPASPRAADTTQLPAVAIRSAQAPHPAEPIADTGAGQTKSDPVPQIWSTTAGSSLRAQIARWADEGGGEYHLVDKDTEDPREPDWRVTQEDSFTGSFLDALTWLRNGFWRAPRPDILVTANKRIILRVLGGGP